VIGLIKGLFGSKKAVDEVKVQEQKPVSSVRQNGQAFFLDMDDARTMGDVNYMRSVKSVKRTFPKTLDVEEASIVKQVSAMAANQKNGKVEAAEPTSAAQPLKPTVDEAAQRRRTDTSMDMFRSMAKGMRGKA
jgi:hypothetical protein